MLTQMIDGQAHGVVLPTEMVYDPTEPYSMIFVIASGDQQQPWEFARSLLTEAYEAPGHSVGLGDVKINVGKVAIDLTIEVASDRMTIRFPTIEVYAFLLETEMIVPSGTEALSLDMNAFFDAV